MMVRVEDVIQIKYDCVCAHVCVRVFACVRGRMRARVRKRAHARVSVYALCACVQQKVSIERVSDAKSTPPTKYFRKYLIICHVGVYSRKHFRTVRTDVWSLL